MYAHSIDISQGSRDAFTVW